MNAAFFFSRLVFIPCKCCWLCVFRTVCKTIDAQNFRHVISNPDAWAVVENRDQCKGLYRNGTISWLGPHNFARVFKVCRTLVEIMFSCLFFLVWHVYVCRLYLLGSHLSSLLQSPCTPMAALVIHKWLYLFFLHLSFNRFFAPPGRDQCAT